LARLQELIEEVWRAEGFTAVLVTHDVPEAVTLADRIVVLEDGQIVDDVAVDLPRPRRLDTAAAARLETRILERLLRKLPRGGSSASGEVRIFVVPFTSPRGREVGGSLIDDA
jgi:ABC-type nitrate/sulfonate/bicarbonate transport system ATPase subunit